eukprot:s1773_g2.t1
MSDDPPSALAAFLGEAPSAAALRRPSSSVPSQRQYARGTGEDSSPDTPGLPQQDGGFDECAEYNGATSAETDLLGSTAIAPGKNRGTKARSAKPPKNTPDLKAPVFAGYAQVPGKRSGSKPPEMEDFSKTSTPMPEGAATMFGEDRSKMICGCVLDETAIARRPFEGLGLTLPNCPRISDQMDALDKALEHLQSSQLMLSRAEVPSKG